MRIHGAGISLRKRIGGFRTGTDGSFSKTETLHGKV